MAAGPIRADEFRAALQNLFKEAEATGLPSITITSREIAERVGRSKRGRYDEMEFSTRALKQSLLDGDEITKTPLKGRGSSFTVKFAMPRSTRGPFNGQLTPLINTFHGQQTDYLEGRKMLREALAFYRNSKLVASAKAKYGYLCRACGFDFQAFYGEIGAGYIECHHIDPISGRGGKNTPTTIDQVVMLCANCHRMIHRKAEALTVAELQEQFKCFKSPVAKCPEPHSSA